VHGIAEYNIGAVGAVYSTY